MNMMNNLFSIFDPSTSMNFSLMWMSIMYMLLIFPKNFWFIKSRFNNFFMEIQLFLIKEFKLILNKNMNLMNIIMFITCFYFILLNNFMGMFMYIFTGSSHMIFGLSLSLVFWISFMLFGWIKNMNIMFIHLIPQNTPMFLMSFMVMIESISNIIRPITLSIRLTANIIAGHLLMTLISSFSLKFSLNMMMMMIISQSLLIILEISVSFIQAYVFTILILLYSIETN